MMGIITIKEAAGRLKLDPRTLRRMIRRGEVPGVLRAEKPIRLSRAAFEEWVNGRV